MDIEIGDRSVSALAIPRTRAIAERLLVSVSPAAVRYHRIPFPVAISHAAWRATVQSIPPGAPATSTPRLDHLLAGVAGALRGDGARYDGDLAYFSLVSKDTAARSVALVLVAGADDDLGSSVLSVLLDAELG